MKLDTQKSRILALFKAYQAILLQHLWKLNEEVMRPVGMTSGEAWVYQNKVMGEAKAKSRASVIFFLNDMVDDTVLRYTEKTGKGGYHRIYFPNMTAAEFEGYIRDLFNDKIDEIFHVGWINNQPFFSGY